MSLTLQFFFLFLETAVCNCRLLDKLLLRTSSCQKFLKKTAFLINLNQVYYCLIFRRACYFTFPLRFIQIFKNTSRKWTKVCNWKCVNPSRSLPLSMPEAAWGGCTPSPLRNPDFYVWSREPHVFYSPKKYFCWRQHKWKNDDINELLLSRGVTG